MEQLSPIELEGRLNAQREVLAVVLARLLQQSGDALGFDMERDLIVQDHQEDPGAIPDPAFAVGAAAASELQLILQRARALRDAR